MTPAQYAVIFIATYFGTFPILGWLMPNVDALHRSMTWLDWKSWLYAIRWQVRLMLATITTFCVWLWHL